MDKVFVKYNGKRPNRTVNLRGGGKVSFLLNRKILALDDYDAMLLLKSNVRLTPDTWEFSVISIGSIDSGSSNIKTETNERAELEVNEDSREERDILFKKVDKKKGGKR